MLMRFFAETGNQLHLCNEASTITLTQVDSYGLNYETVHTLDQQENGAIIELDDREF